jgi:predicted GTPase
VIGTTSVGKSSILNALINPRNNPASLIQKPLSENGQQQTNGNVSTTSQRMFRVQTFEKQMLSEHCTNGMY